jgi:hypothetical protein
MLGPDCDESPLSRLQRATIPSDGITHRIIVTIPAAPTVPQGLCRMFEQVERSVEPTSGSKIRLALLAGS